MFNEVVTDTNIVYYLMIAIGVVGVLAKVVNQITLRRLVRAAGNMSKSTHKLIKLVRAKYEHALMLHDRVENAEAFVEKYIYEYRGFLLRIHTWRQLEMQSIWFSGILAAFGGIIWYMENGFCEEMYRYISLGAAEMVLLFVISQLSDERYKIEAGKNYMVDYLENVCAMRRRKARQSEKERIDIIQPETSQALRANGKDMEGNEAAAGREAAAGNGAVKGRNFSGGSRGTAGRNPAYGTRPEEAVPEAPGLSISIEGEPRKARTGVSGDTAPMYEAAETLAMAAGKDYGYDENAGRDFGYGGADGKREAASGYSPSAEKGEAAPGYGSSAGKGEAAPGYGSSAGRGVSASGGNAGGRQMKRIPGRFQDVVQRMIEDTSEYEEVLEGPPLPEDAPYSAGRTDRGRAEGENSPGRLYAEGGSDPGRFRPEGGNDPDRLRQTAEYMEAGASYGDGDGDDVRDYERVRRKNRKKGDATRQVLHRTIKGNPEVSEREGSNMKEEAIRQILEEFLA